MVAIWREWLKQHGGHKAAFLPLLFLTLLLFTYAVGGGTARGQESPLATPPPAEAPPVEVPPTVAPPQTFVPLLLPSISGVITNDDGEPVAGLVVIAYKLRQSAWSIERQTTTNAQGEYRFPWMPAGNYRLAIRDPQGFYASIYYPDSADIEEGSDVAMMGNALTGVNIEVSAGGQISGTLSWQDGPSPFNSEIEVYYVTDEPISTQLTLNDKLNLAPELRHYRLVASKNFTEPVVNYNFTGLASGSYRVCASAVAFQTNAFECFDDAALGIHSTDVVVTDGATVGDVEIVFGDGADLSTLTGTLTAGENRPATEVNVEVIAQPDTDFFTIPQPFRTTTDAQGNFSFDELPFGSYTVRFSDPRGLYLASSYRTPTEQGPTSLVVLDRNDTVSITMAITPSALITGLVTIDGSIAGMGGQVTAFSQNSDGGWIPGGTGQIVAATGAYTVTNLPPGGYRLQYSVDLPASIFYGEPGATLETATVVSVTTGTVVGNINVDLTPYIAGVPFGTISGQVVMDGAPQADMQIWIFDAAYDCCIAPQPYMSVPTDAEGRFSVAGIPPGRYKVGVSVPEQPHPTLYATDQRTFELATPFQIGNPVDGVSRQIFSDVNFTLVATGSLSRTVRRADDTPVAGVKVNIYQRIGDAGAWPLVASTQTNETGQYTFSGLIPDIYQVCILAPEIVESTCGGRSGSGMGLDVVITAGQEATGIDILPAQ